MANGGEGLVDGDSHDYILLIWVDHYGPMVTKHAEELWFHWNSSLCIQLCQIFSGKMHKSMRTEWCQLCWRTCYQQSFWCPFWVVSILPWSSNPCCPQFIKPVGSRWQKSPVPVRHGRTWVIPKALTTTVPRAPSPVQPMLTTLRSPRPSSGCCGMLWGSCRYRRGSSRLGLGAWGFAVGGSWSEGHGPWFWLPISRSCLKACVCVCVGRFSACICTVALSISFQMHMM